MNGIFAVSLNAEQGDVGQDASGYCQCCSQDKGFLFFMEVLHDHTSDSFKLARQGNVILNSLSLSSLSGI